MLTLGARTLYDRLVGLSSNGHEVARADAQGLHEEGIDG